MYGLAPDQYDDGYVVDGHAGDDHVEEGGIGDHHTGICLRLLLSCPLCR